MLLSQLQFFVVILTLIFQLLQLSSQRPKFLLDALCTCRVLCNQRHYKQPRWMTWYDLVVAVNSVAKPFILVHLKLFSIYNCSIMEYCSTLPHLSASKCKIFPKLPTLAAYFKKISPNAYQQYLQCLETVGWASGRASGL